MTYDPATIWLIIVLLAFGTFFVRFSFLGLSGSRPIPVWLLRHLRYTPVAVLPGLVAPMVLWPAATGGVTDPARLAAAFAALAIGALTRNMILAIIGGMAVLYLVSRALV